MPDDDDFKLYEFSIVEFCQICGIDCESGKNYSSLKESIKKLRDTSRWVMLEDGSETTISWIEKPYINKNSGIVKIRLDKDLKPFLLQLKKQFTHYSLYFVLAMQSQYSIRLYELLKSYQYQRICEFDIDDLRLKLGAENYQRYPDFRRFVLEAAIKEINELGDINAIYELEKEGKRYSKITFKITPKDGTELRNVTYKNIEKRLMPKKTHIPGQLSLFMPTDNS
jgi:plasmid replication initiation protein